MKTTLPILLAALLATAPAPAAPRRVTEAERLAREALATADPAQAEALARRALKLTEEFEPTDFVGMGRKGEVVEDAFLAAREAYRRHRAPIYEALGVSLLKQGRTAAAVRYLRRALVLHPDPGRVARLAGALLDESRGAEAWHLLQAHVGSRPDPRLFERTADLLQLPSAQHEIDRARLRKLDPPVPTARVPVKVPNGTRLSTGAPFVLGPEPVVLYLAEQSCRTCSRDLEALARVVPEGAKVAMLAEDPDHDHALRQVMGLYGHRWPMVVGRGTSEALPVDPGSVLVVSRRGWGTAVVEPPFAALPAVLDVLGRADLTERAPRERWNQKPPTPPAPPVPPAVLPEGLVPGEDEPVPEAWTAAVAAYRAGRYAEALERFDQLAAAPDGWLLSPEARLDRALALAGLGRHDRARALLLGIGDSRVQDAVDRALEQVGSRTR